MYAICLPYPKLSPLLGRRLAPGPDRFGSSGLRNRIDDGTDYEDPRRNCPIWALALAGDCGSFCSAHQPYPDERPCAHR